MTQELSTSRKTIVGIQFLFVAFGSTVLVPLLVGLDPATALFTAGVGTLIFHLVTKGQVPIFLGSSFAFIAPIISASQQWGMPGTIAGIAGVALVYFVMSALVKWRGHALIARLFPTPCRFQRIHSSLIEGNKFALGLQQPAVKQHSSPQGEKRNCTQQDYQAVGTMDAHRK